MHRTDTLDCLTCVRGEIYLVTDTDETLMRPGDTVIIRGTNHAWSNRQGFGNVICWRLYGGEAPGQITEMVITNSRTGGGRELTRQQAEAAVGFAISDLCPDAAPD